MNALERLGLEVAAFQLLGTRMKAATLCALLDANGRPVSADHLAAGRPWKGQEITDTGNVIKTRICLLRETLDDVGLGDPIQTHRGRGYSLPEPDRSRVIERLTEVAA